MGRVTAPLTPHDEQPPLPPVPDGERRWQAMGLQVRRALVVVVAVGVCGALMGLLWLWLAPRVPLISDGSAVYLKDSEGEQAIGADGWFTLLGLGMGLLTAIGVHLWRRSAGIAVVVGLALGGLVASVLAWRMGVWLGPPQNVVAHARQVGVNKIFHSPLQLRAKGALLAWPAASMAALLALTSAFTHAPQPEPQWQGWGEPPLPPDGAQYPQHPEHPDGPQHPQHPEQ